MKEGRQELQAERRHMMRRLLSAAWAVCGSVKERGMETAKEPGKGSMYVWMMMPEMTVHTLVIVHYEQPKMDSWVKD
jgi:hypothetical protein